jgi:hypothetical protein
MTSATISGALERLRHLAPFAKPSLLKACVETPAPTACFGLRKPS